MTHTLPDRAHSAPPATAATARRPYLAYRDSGVPWLGQIPAHWEVKRLKEHADVISGYPFESELFSSTTGTPLIRIRDLTAEQTETFYTGPVIREALVHDGDILIGMDGDFLSSWWCGGTALLNQRLCCLRPHITLNDRFLHYMLPYPLKVINDLTWFTTVKHLSTADVMSIRFALPPLDEQRAIAAYLDRETARLDALIAAKQRLIALLREKRAALISHAVTRGLDASVPLQDSGVSWLGQIPVHWQVKRTKHVARLATGHTPSRQHPEYWENCTIPWVSLADVWQLRNGRAEYIEDTAEYISELGLANSSAVRLPAGTVILSRTASVGFSGIMSRPMATTQDFANWVCGPTLRPEYLLYVFRSMEHELHRLTMGSTHQTIYMPDVGRFVTPLPPLDEQDAIVRYSRENTTRIDTLSDKLSNQIEKLREYRSAVIAAAVTGQFDVL